MPGESSILKRKKPFRSCSLTPRQTAGNALADGFTQRIIAAIKSVKRGQVTSYGAIAAAAGNPGGARQVVRVLHACSEKEGLPWHRIVRKDGSIALPRGGGFERQKALLEAEGVVVDGAGRIRRKGVRRNVNRQ
jgi:methylated-DNA-protein-cysteine methyltransferase related protein